ncbi:hypothetical protein KCU99_g342, partial [Aureobasidium melanogenum]
MSRKSYEVAAITEDDGPASSYAVPMIISIHNRISDRRVAVQRHKEGHANKYIQHCFMNIISCRADTAGCTSARCMVRNLVREGYVAEVGCSGTASRS